MPAGMHNIIKSFNSGAIMKDIKGKGGFLSGFKNFLGKGKKFLQSGIGKSITNFARKIPILGSVVDVVEKAAEYVPDEWGGPDHIENTGGRDPSLNYSPLENTRGTEPYYDDNVQTREGFSHAQIVGSGSGLGHSQVPKYRMQAPPHNTIARHERMPNKGRAHGWGGGGESYRRANERERMRNMQRDDDEEDYGSNYEPQYPDEELERRGRNDMDEDEEYPSISYDSGLGRNVRSVEPIGYDDDY